MEKLADEFGAIDSRSQQVFSGVVMAIYGWRPLICCNTTWSLIANVCTKLHNLCIDRYVAPRYLHDWIIGDSDVICFHDEDQ